MEKVFCDCANSGIFPAHTYAPGLQNNGYLAIPVLGLAMSPAPVCWVWFVCGLLVLRRRTRTAIAVFVPVGVVLLTFLAGPVSGGQRYALTLFMALPLAVGAVVLAARPRPPVARDTSARMSTDAPPDPPGSPAVSPDPVRGEAAGSRDPSAQEAADRLVRATGSGPPHR